ncbi:MAG: oligosaccharide flippase family protein [Ferruginibacter sp.]
MANKLAAFIPAKLKSKLFTNSAWGIVSNILQNVLFSIFFIVIARKYSTDDFGNYIIANTLYGFVVAFSTLGLGYWFVRELKHADDKKVLVRKFFKIQLYSGILFYFVNVIMAYVIYDSQLVRYLSVLIGINVIFDNIIYVIKFMNVADSEQKKTFVILTIEAVLKFVVACILFIWPINIIYLSLLLILLRLISLNLFIKYGSNNIIKLREIIFSKISRKEIKHIIASNWSFMIIGSISVIYWKIGNILVSKILTLTDVANYEISYKLFSMGYILPIIVSTSIYPLLIDAYKQSKEKMSKLYHNAFLAYALYGLLAYTFIYSFADIVIPWLFGNKYADTSFYCKEMFLTMITFPTVFLQANVLITMKLEKLDMLCNFVSLVLNVGLCIVGFVYFQKSLSVVNYAIFFSFTAFHLIQDVVLIQKGVTKLIHVIAFYATCAGIVFFYYFLADHFNKEWLFFVFWAILLGIAGTIFFINKKRAVVTAEDQLSKIPIDQ